MLRWRRALNEPLNPWMRNLIVPSETICRIGRQVAAACATLPHTLTDGAQDSALQPLDPPPNGKEIGGSTAEQSAIGTAMLMA
jgi:hypothetical protein